jgi:hypothetical protein
MYTYAARVWDLFLSPVPNPNSPIRNVSIAAILAALNDVDIKGNFLPKLSSHGKERGEPTHLENELEGQLGEPRRDQAPDWEKYDSRGEQDDANHCGEQLYNQ